VDRPVGPASSVGLSAAGSPKPGGWLARFVRSPWLAGALLLAAVLIAYLPARHAGFIWDDDEYVTQNPLLKAPDGLRRIWFSLDSPSQYFPLTYTTFLVEQRFWGLHPAGYHWVNILLHAANALLVWRLLRRLTVPGAWLAAAIFALHPVQVESVAWITERKNVLSLLFSLLALLAWTRFVEEQPRRLWRWYALALMCYALALLSKTTACTLPAAMLLVLWLRARPSTSSSPSSTPQSQDPGEGRARGGGIGVWSRLAQIVPFLVLGAGMGLLAMWWERYHQGTQGKLFALGLPERLLVASHAVWFYLGKLLWPANLTFSYPRWALDAANPLAYGWLLAIAGLGVVIYFTRRFAGRGVEVAALFFVATLSPMLGFIMLYTFRYTFVADHYQYAASIGPIALAAGVIATVLGRSAVASAARPAKAARLQQVPTPLDVRRPLRLGQPRSGPKVAPLRPTLRWGVILRPALCAALLVALGALTWRQCGMYADHDTLWRTTAERNPNSFLAYNNLGYLLFQDGRTDEAIAQYRRSLEIEPDYELAHYNLGNALLKKGLAGEAIAHYQQALEARPNVAEFHNNLGTALLQVGRLDEAIAQGRRAVELAPRNANAHNNLAIGLRRQGQWAEAQAHYQKALELVPMSVAIRNNLARMLATCPEASVRDGTNAVALAQQANQLSHGKSAMVLQTLAAAYAESGRFPEAVSTAQEALPLANAQHNDVLAGNLQEQIRLYKASTPLRESNP
jgi:tetratricopeptide (TPR) repeat protein